ncbi:MAG TPA: glycosyltransferase [Streptosporangiaceae bacterium]|jgi:glycosyltransferase involved in cell wall biosynthesis
MRIMLVTDQYAPMVGGVPTVTRTLALGLAQRGHTVALLAPSPGWRGRLDTEQQVRVYYRGSVPWPWHAGMRLARLPRAAARGLLSRFAPDVIHIHSPVTLGLTAAIGARQLGIPVVYTNHYLPANLAPARQRRPRGFDALFYAYVVGFSNRCSHVTAPTATALRLLRARGLRVPSRVISNGVDLAQYAPGPADERLRERYGLPRGRTLILSVGRLSPEKRVDVLLHAASQLRQDACVVIAGSGPDEAGLRARAARLSLTGPESRVRFLGFVPGPDLPGLYRLADIFAIASEAELQSLTTMEAMATGLPVVAVRSHALGELVTDRHNGFLVTPGHGGELAACLDRLAADPGLRRAMAAASLRIIGGHERHRWLAEWEALYGLLAVAAAGERAR